MKELHHDFFGINIIVRIGEKEQSIIPISIVDPVTSEAWGRVFNYDVGVQILEKNQEKVTSLVSAYQKKSQRGSSFFLMVINTLISVLSGIESAIKGFLGMFTGRGLIGIFFIFLLIMTSLLVSIYILMVAAPLYLVAYIVKYKMKKKTNMEITSLQNAILAGL